MPGCGCGGDRDEKLHTAADITEFIAEIKY